MLTKTGTALHILIPKEKVKQYPGTEAIRTKVPTLKSLVLVDNKEYDSNWKKIPTLLFIVVFESNLCANFKTLHLSCTVE